MKDSPIRRALTWWFAAPYDPWVCINFAVDATAARAYLAALPRSPRVTMNHLVAAVIGRTLREHPYANGRVIHDKIVLLDEVRIAMPVSVVDGDLGRELSLATVRGIDKLSLVEIAERSTRAVTAEREGRASDPWVRSLLAASSSLPGPAFNRAMDALDRVMNRSPASEALFRAAGMTTALSNVGATFGQQRGMLFRGASVSPPQRLFQVGTFWGCGAVQDEIVPVDGQAAVRPMLPVLFLFDHRLFDGVRAGRIATTFGDYFRGPASVLGLDGRAS